MRDPLLGGRHPRALAAPPTKLQWLRLERPHLLHAPIAAPRKASGLAPPLRLPGLSRRPFPQRASQSGAAAQTGGRRLGEHKRQEMQGGSPHCNHNYLPTPTACTPPPWPGPLQSTEGLERGLGGQPLSSLSSQPSLLVCEMGSHLAQGSIRSFISTFIECLLCLGPRDPPLNQRDENQQSWDPGIASSKAGRLPGRREGGPEFCTQHLPMCGGARPFGKASHTDV